MASSTEFSKSGHTPLIRYEPGHRSQFGLNVVSIQFEDDQIQPIPLIYMVATGGLEPPTPAL